MVAAALARRRGMNETLTMYGARSSVCQFERSVARGGEGDRLWVGGGSEVGIVDRRRCR